MTKAWRENNTDHINEYNKQYRSEHREKRRSYDRRWRKENKDYWRHYQNERLQNNIDYRLHNYISRALRRGIKKNCQSVFDLLGYSVEDLRRHLESLFQTGMSWQNYGTSWHIDHIVPKSWFNLETTDGVDRFELELCWSLRNLQPLWSSENLKKKNSQISGNETGTLPKTRDQFRVAIERHKRGEIVLVL